ncbi:hypothetical protein AB3464_18135 [Pseudomonas asplenii]
MGFLAQGLVLLALVELIAKVLQAIAIDAFPLLHQAMQFRERDIGRAQVGALVPTGLVEVKRIPAP